MNQWKKVGLVIAFGLILAGCSTTLNSSENGGVGQSVPVDGGGEYIDITPGELNVMMADKDFFFVNVHIPYDGEIPDTDAFIAFDEVKARLGGFPTERDAKIVLYCRSGSMSASAARELVQAGYTNIFNLDGGFRAWSQSGFEFFQ